MSELTEEGASQDVARGLDGRMEMVLVDVVIGWRLSINLRRESAFMSHVGTLRGINNA